jgi:diguanylate cyclase (GGDEF)-like protein
VASRLSSGGAWTLAVLCTVATVLLDWFSGAVISMSPLYMLSTAVAVWCLGERKGLMVSVIGATAGATLKHFDFMWIQVHGQGVGLATEGWNLFARILSIALIAVVANGFRIALAIERWRASSDALTGALNKAAFREQAEIAAVQARAQDRAIVLAYMDLDGFKGVNDRHGHSAGDRVLRAFATAAMGAIRDTDLFARIGGDEFVALMVVRSCDEGDQVAEMLHGRLTDILRETGFRVTCSMGVLVSEAANFDLDGGGIELADMLMYEVKRSGKDALRIARGGIAGQTLNMAYPPVTDGKDLDDILARIDQADRDHDSARQRRAAA